jgi:hypothetical protein
LPTHSGGEDSAAASNHSKVMAFSGLRSLVILLGAAFIAGSSLPAFAQSSETKPTDQQKPDAKKMWADELAAVARALTGPAANPECIWLGKRVVSLLFRDDTDTALRQLTFYDRFGCPGAHVKDSFRCVVRQGPLDSKAAVILDERVQECWRNPNTIPASATAAPATNAGGTGAR